MAGELGWSEFVEGALALGRHLLEPNFDAENHGRTLGALAAALDPNDPDLTALFHTLETGQTEDYRTAQIAKTETCGVMLVTLRAGGRVGLHEHPEQSGFILCYGGRVDVDAFDIESEDPLHLRQVFSSSLTPGQTASLTPDRQNIHRLHCPHATRQVDVFTPPLSDVLREGCRSFVLLEAVE